MCPIAEQQASLVQDNDGEEVTYLRAQACPNIATIGPLSSIQRASQPHVAHAESAQTDRRSDLTAGQWLKDRFYLEREIGRGGMSTLFLARDERLLEAGAPRPYVVIKVLNEVLQKHPYFLYQELRSCRLLTHEGIVRIFDLDRQDSLIFLVMEYIEGDNLATLLGQSNGRGIPFKLAWPWIKGVADALEYAHDIGIVHGDIKPSNIMVMANGLPKVLDWGMAKPYDKTWLLADDDIQAPAVPWDAITPAYASLEVTQGQPALPSDDVYALGCMIFELLTGQHPFKRRSGEAAMHEGLAPPPVPELSPQQYHTLCASIAFYRRHRLRNISSLLQGMHGRSISQRAITFLRSGLHEQFRRYTTHS